MVDQTLRGGGGDMDFCVANGCDAFSNLSLHSASLHLFDVSNLATAAAVLCGSNNIV